MTPPQMALARAPTTVSQRAPPSRHVGERRTSDDSDPRVRQRREDDEQQRCHRGAKPHPRAHIRAPAARTRRACIRARPILMRRPAMPSSAAELPCAPQGEGYSEDRARPGRMCALRRDEAVRRALLRDELAGARRCRAAASWRGSLRDARWGCVRPCAPLAPSQGSSQRAWCVMSASTGRVANFPACFDSSGSTIGVSEVVLRSCV